MANAGKHMGGGDRGQKGPRRAGLGAGRPRDTLDEADLADDIMGRNELQGTDQSRFPNERQRQAGEHGEPYDVMEGLHRTEQRADARERASEQRREEQSRGDR
ncbi:hypothetical protein [Rhodoligotrophos defluvii]|uniref:hypothetical protein n=1 Tax=Rhodoligotrophos defluvii TaxID=2561934 RepID=UPI0010C9552E|nr:hypothetical protein [Rhodoligotrophos defluvii]